MAIYYHRQSQSNTFQRNLALLWIVLLLSGLVSSSVTTTEAASFSVDNVASLGSLNLNSTLAQPKLNQSVAGPIKVQGSNFVDNNGSRFFLSGVNYEGHTDRAWAMWNDGKFDPNLINQNLALAAQGGHNAIRIFIQPAIRDDITSGRWYKLDKVVEIAAQNNLQVLITFADYDELDLTRLSQIDNLVAQHFSGSPNVLGYDLKNEPQFVDLAGGKYPEGQTPRIQTDALIQAYGELVTLTGSEYWRQTPAGQKVVPPWLDARGAYYFTNAYKLYQSFLDEGSKWVVSHTNTTFLDWLKSADSTYWKPFVEALSATLDTWIGIRQGAIRAQDADKPVTIGFNHPYFAFLDANQSLSFVSLHRFAPEEAGSIYTTFMMLDQLKGQHPGHPIVLEEFGYTNSHGVNRSVPMKLTASYEAAIWLFLYSRGYAGGFKWMLTNFSAGFNPDENNFGLLDDQARPKLAYYVARAIHNYIAANPTPSGDFTLLESKDGTEISYMWASGDAIFSNIKDYTNNKVDLHQQEQVGWQVWWPGSNRSQVYFTSASNGRVTLDLGKFFPTWNPNNAPTLIADRGQPPGLDRKGGLVSFSLEANLNYTINVPMTPDAFQRTAALKKPNSSYFKETGHNLSNTFKKYWEEHGGLWLYGFPISEEFQEGDNIVQYFERNRFEYHPEAKGTIYEVQLGLLGLNVTAGRKESGDPPFQPIDAETLAADSNYFRETSHSLGGSFRNYWQKYGGLAQFGFPISEEFTELNQADGKTYTVQYFERARFEYHTEAKDTPNEVMLGLLGNQVVKLKGWMF
ncbi:MAG: hypothetical protein WCS37_01585 [Chloroflexota bacterium]|nr:hypothetical protein [Chloroflexota bacterium]